jgi:TatD DNase family protein
VVSQAKLEFVDTHCHLNFDDYNDDRRLVIERAQNNGISRILIPGIDIETSKTALECAWEFPEIYAAVGLHPNQGSSWSNNTISDIRKLAENNKVVAIGEIGLDYYRNRTSRTLQQLIFEEQLELAMDLGLPVIIHNRDASKDIQNIVQKWHRKLTHDRKSLADRPGVLHSFSGDEIFADAMISIYFKIGITGPVTFNNSKSLHSIIASLPIDNLLIETDSPFLTPHPFRGKRNEPANVRIVAEKIAELKNESLDNIAKITTVTADKLFLWREIH